MMGFNPTSGIGEMDIVCLCIIFPETSLSICPPTQPVLFSYALGRKLSKEV
jgi:hypothetical protein